MRCVVGAVVLRGCVLRAGCGVCAAGRCVGRRRVIGAGAALEGGGGAIVRLRGSGALQGGCGRVWGRSYCRGRAVGAGALIWSAAL